MTCETRSGSMNGGKLCSKIIALEMKICPFRFTAKVSNTCSSRCSIYGGLV